ncbi:hypothetical protein A7D02_07365 [Aeromonas salmonicida]|uniref:Uncharacterized protein n=1 Tax=Aeromonas salmonicida subsp. salmonicida TaxID=29491 RepID=A0A1B2LQG7_AERSS|nr:hypothetical protein [Aeromonas salmonicida]AOA33826.1 hypothetical protein [Aeromonas salmonicida subsp. salmonicida]ORJ13425.1 hypothetical protein A7D02_07365 [Aeromonas salmonicida]
MSNIAPITQSKGGFLMEPQNLQEAMQLADMLANSNLVPKSYQGKAGDVLVACQWGSEIGLKPLQALQNIAVINNVPAVWGDALVALVRGSGLCEYIKQDWDPSTKTATCSVKRRGEPEETRTFSEEDARLAGHLSKDTYKKNLQRMLSIRARAFALRDVFADVLKGLKVAEEVEDYPAERDITPTPASSQQEKPASRTSVVLDRIKSVRDKPVEQQEPATIEVEPQPVDHSNAYADHCAAIEGAASVEEWTSAYTTAWAWAGETGDQTIADGIKQVAGERKAQLNKAK